MKRIVALILTLVVLFGCLTACSFNQNLSGSFAGKAESASKVEEMMTALADEQADAAKALMHPDSAEKSDDAIAQITAYLAGRKATDIEMIKISVNTSTGTAGKVRQEQVAYQVTLDDGEVIYLNVSYLSNNDGIGFVYFQVVLGVI